MEGEHDVINLGKVEGYMAAALQSLKHEYTTSVTARITPGIARDTYPLHVGHVGSRPLGRLSWHVLLFCSFVG